MNEPLRIIKTRSVGLSYYFTAQSLKTRSPCAGAGLVTLNDPYTPVLSLTASAVRMANRRKIT